MHPWIAQFLIHEKPLAYAIIFIGMMIEGDALLFVAAFLTHQGFFNPIFMFINVFAGAIIGDMLWYSAGISIKKHAGRAHEWIQHVTSRFDVHLLHKTGRTLLISKFAYGLHHILLTRAGAIAVAPKKFLQKDLAATLLWILIVGSLGYFSSASFASHAGRFLRVSERVLVASLLVFLAIEYLAARIVKEKL